MKMKSAVVFVLLACLVCASAGSVSAGGSPNPGSAYVPNVDVNALLSVMNSTLVFSGYTTIENHITGATNLSLEALSGDELAEDAITLSATNVKDATASAIETLTVVNQSDEAAEPYNYSNVNVEVHGEKNSLMALLLEDSWTARCNASYALSVFMSNVSGENNSTALIFNVYDGALTLCPDDGAAQSFLYAQNCSIVVRDAGTHSIIASFDAVESDNFLFSLTGNVLLTMNATNYLMSVAAEEQALTMRVTPADRNALMVGYENITDSFAGMIDFLSAGEGGNDTGSEGSAQAPFNISQILDGFSPLMPALNGAFIGTGVSGSVSFNGAPQETLSSGIIMLRGDLIDVSVEGSGDAAVARLGASCTIAFLNNYLYNEHNGEGVYLGPVLLPEAGVILWVIAIAIALISFVRSRLLRKKEKGANTDTSGADANSEKINKLDKTLRLPLFLGHLFVLILVFFLFDAEVERLFGLGLISQLYHLPSFLVGIGTASSGDITGMLEVLPFLAGFCIVVIPFILALFFFAMPISLIVRSLINLFGYRKINKRIGQIVGAFAILFMGIGYVTFFLNTLVQQLLPMLPF